MFMKKLLIYSILLFAALQLKAQSGIVFKPALLPDHNYDLSIDVKYTIKLDSTISITDEDNESPELKAMHISSENYFDYNIKTGRANKQNEIPLSIYYSNITSKHLINDKESSRDSTKSPWLNQHVYGKYDSRGNFELDSVTKKGVNESIKTSLVNFVNSLTNPIKFPENALKTGDSFTQNLPLNIIAAGKIFQVQFQVDYKLIEIKNGTAYFDFNETPDLASLPKDGSLKIVAHGTGKLEYAIKDHYPTSTASDLVYSYTLNTENTPVHGTIKASNIRQVKINAQ
jgi:hypothetical protein